jgi:NOL1/NOP2/fmu family ribosome biogenesis protein
MSVLNTREKKRFLELLHQRWGFSGELPVLFQNNEGRVYLCTSDLQKAEGLRVDTFGLYLGKFQPEGFALSIEGSQLVGPKASKNIADVSRSQAAAWMKGEDISGEGEGFVIIRSGHDFLGSGKASVGRIINRVPKVRRVSLAEQAE